VGALRRAVQIAPFNLVAWGYLALSLGVAGGEAEAGEARRILDRLIETAPEDPSLPYWSFFRGAVSTREGRLEEAVADARRTVELQPYFFLAAVGLANALGALGREEDARAAWQRVQAIHPGFTAEGYAREIGLQATRPERAEPHLAGLRAAGILASPRDSGGTGPDGSAGRATADPSSPVQVGAPRDDGPPVQVGAPRDDGPPVQVGAPANDRPSPGPSRTAHPTRPEANGRSFAQVDPRSARVGTRDDEGRP
jgi:hypothetical protein